jgi:hypothetical protein
MDSSSVAMPRNFIVWSLNASQEKKGDALYLWVKAGMIVNIQQPQALALKHTPIATV